MHRQGASRSTINSCVDCFGYNQYYRLLVDFFVSFVATHFAQSVLEHYILLEQVVNRHFVLSVVVHRALEEEAQEALSTPTAGASSEVAKQYEVETDRKSVV